jgi:D-glycero-alpha-D-manno-heptose 1-phosphate guanylyltransferase
MECIILAGGLGTRLKDILPDIPKPLAPINGIPFLDLLIKQVSAFKAIDKIILAIGYKADAIIKHIEEKTWSLPIEFSQEETPLGTGGALKKALKLCKQDTVLALNGDSYLALDFDSFLKHHVKNHADITLAYTETDNASRYGQIMIDSTSQRILAFHEKDAKISKGFINGGIYLMRKNIFDRLSLPDSFSIEKDAFVKFLKYNFLGFFCSGTFIDIGTKESYLKGQTILKKI